MRTFCCSCSSSFWSLLVALPPAAEDDDGFWGVAEISSRFLLVLLTLSLPLALLLLPSELTRLDTLESNDMASAKVVVPAPSAASSADDAESSIPVAFRVFFLAHGFSCCARSSILVGRLSVLLPPELDDDEEADPLDEGRLLLLPLVLAALPALRGLRAAALLEAVPLWNRPVEGRRLAAAEDDEEGRPVRVVDEEDLDEADGLPVDGVDEDEERVDRRFRGAEARGIVACCCLWLSLSLFLEFNSSRLLFATFGFGKTNEPDLPKRSGTERSQYRAIKRRLPGEELLKERGSTRWRRWGCAGICKGGGRGPRAFEGKARKEIEQEVRDVWSET